MLTSCTFAESSELVLRPTPADLLEQAVYEITPAFMALVAEGREELDRQGRAPLEDPLALLIEAARHRMDRRGSAKDELAMVKRAPAEDAPIEEDLA